MSCMHTIRSTCKMENNAKVRTADLQSLTSFGTKCGSSCRFRIVSNPKMTDFNMGQGVSEMFPTCSSSCFSNIESNALSTFSWPTMSSLLNECASSCSFTLNSNTGLTAIDLSGITQAMPKCHSTCTFEVNKNAKLAKLDMKLMGSWAREVSSQGDNHMFSISHNPLLEAIDLSSLLGAGSGYCRKPCQFNIQHNKKLKDLKLTQLAYIFGSTLTWPGNCNYYCYRYKDNHLVQFDYLDSLEKLELPALRYVLTGGYQNSYFRVRRCCWPS